MQSFSTDPRGLQVSESSVVTTHAAEAHTLLSLSTAAFFYIKSSTKKHKNFRFEVLCKMATI